MSKKINGLVLFIADSWLNKRDGVETHLSSDQVLPIGGEGEGCDGLPVKMRKVKETVEGPWKPFCIFGLEPTLSVLLSPRRVDEVLLFVLLGIQQDYDAATKGKK